MSSSNARSTLLAVHLCRLADTEEGLQTGWGAGAAVERSTAGSRVGTLPTDGRRRIPWSLVTTTNVSATTELARPPFPEPALRRARGQLCAPRCHSVPDTGAGNRAPARHRGSHVADTKQTSPATVIPTPSTPASASARRVAGPERRRPAPRSHHLPLAPAGSRWLPWAPAQRPARESR